MKRNKWTEHRVKILIEMYPDNNAKEISRFTGMSVNSVYNKAHELKLQKSKEFWESPISGRLTGEVGKRYRFQKGNSPWNAGRHDIRLSPKSEFKKGHLPANTKHDGAISLRYHQLKNSHKKRPMYWIRISKGQWIPLSQKLWIDKHGPIPEGHIVVFRDGNPLNCVYKNLELITKAENARRNRNYEKSSQTNRANWEEGGTDRVIASYFVGADKELQQELIQNQPELLDLKRTQFQLNNQIKNEKRRR